MVTQPHLAHNPLELRRLVPLARRDHRSQRHAQGVADEVELGAGAAARPAQGVVLRLAGSDLERQNYMVIIDLQFAGFLPREAYRLSHPGVKAGGSDAELEARR
ncbi:hypothetical protein EP7_001921 [Isosphaeraceae bacterium EP7]